VSPDTDEHSLIARERVVDVAISAASVIKCFVFGQIWQSTSSTFDHIAIKSTGQCQQSVNTLSYAINLPYPANIVNIQELGAISDHMHDLDLVKIVNMMTIFTIND
jgi:hypothetical protein